MVSGIWSGHSASPARPVDQQARDTLHALSSISTHSRLPFGNGALRVPPSLPFSWFHVKPLRAIALVQREHRYDFTMPAARSTSFADTEAAHSPST